ncbi:MAG: hypothetical protein KJ584_01730 [Candidatus Omnitrophica bacterium]|nr:hypothetical protein [Candidatus Omnitrophota bacterium]
MRNIIAVSVMCLFVCGCATSCNVWREIAGTSIKGVEDARVDAMKKILNYDYKTCYEKVEAFLKKMPYVSVYYKDKGMIAIYVTNPNTTSVGIFFAVTDAGHTQVDVSSESTPTKEWVANSIFSETVLPQEKSNIDIM